MSEPVSATSTHKTLISLGLILIVMILLVEVSGTSKTASNVVLLLLLGTAMLLGIQESTRFTKFSQSYPWTP